MPDTQKQGLVKKQKLTGAEIAEIEQLIAVTNSYEGLHMRLGLDMLRTMKTVGL